MSDFTPLTPGDPRQLGGLEVLGRLGHGGQGVVYLAKTPMGARVAVKWLSLSEDEGSVERFLREAEVAGRVAPFCTAAVLGTGVEQGRPYIISEYVEGRTLDRAVKDGGPIAGGDLERLAIGTATALAAIHEAEIVHRDFKPGNVIMGPGGPRVIDFGIARTLDPATMTSSTQIGTPAYMAPEQIMGQGLGPAADVFSWACTMVFASSGRAPFGSDATHPVMNRVLHGAPDLGLLDGGLRALVLECLAKDPASRPTARDVILRLLRNPRPGADPLAEGTMQAAPSPGDNPSGHKPSRLPILIGAGVVVVAIAVAATIVVPRWLRSTTPPPAAVASATTPSRAATTTPPPAAPVKTALPGGSVTLWESPADPITLTSYELYDKKLDDDVDYARRSARGAFEKLPANLDSLTSPSGRYLAGRSFDYTSDGYDSILITDRQTGSSSFRVKTVRKPMTTSLRSWSKDSSKILLDLNKKIKDAKGEEVWNTVGFAVIEVAQDDVARSRLRTVDLEDASIGKSDFGWDGSESGVVIVYGEDEGLRFYDSAGKRVRDLPGVGPLAAGPRDIFSPSGRMFVTDCPGDAEDDQCLWDAGTGRQVRKFRSDCEKVLGWYDESHLYCWEQDNGANSEIRVVALDGKLLRRLVEVGEKDDLTPYFTVTPTGS
ncbi:serine/threonine-protein kinase [Nonomuraea sp. NPDC050404]|uniref:serine/threonine protein kinase n=1 Tax=Nonomuraea sp. NPDC050404 TaxID=3155783 RepID=UPI0033F96F7C